MTDFIVAAVLAIIIIAAAVYVYKARKRGVKCIGCPEGTCSGGCNCQCNKN